MASNIDRLATKLGAERVAELPETGGGAFGAARLSQMLRQRLEPSRGERPGRPTDPHWNRRPKVPMTAETEARLSELARLASSTTRQVSPMQVAAQLLEDAVGKYFRRSAGS